MSHELKLQATPSGFGPAEAYLLVPVLIFWEGYIGGAVGGLLALAPLVWIGLCWRAGVGGSPVPMRAWWIGVLLAIPVLVVMGFPQGPWAWDWFKHWALMGALADHPWPVWMELQGESWALRFYLAAYLVPALLAKLWPAIGLTWAAALWFGLGVGLVLARVSALAGDTARAHRQTGQPGQMVAVVLTPALFLLLAGADGCIEYGLRTVGLAASAGPGLHTEWWAWNWLSVLWQFTGPLAALAWVPHQAIATFLVAFALADAPERAPWGAALGLALLSLWSPFGLVGLLPVLAWRLVQSRGDWWGRRESRVPAAAGVLLLAPLVLAAAAFLASGLPSTGLAWPVWPVWREHAAPGLVFVGLELLPCALILGRRLWREPLLRLCVVELVVIAWLGGGEPPDFVMRSSCGPLAIVLLQAALAFPQRWAQGRRGALLAMLGLGLSLPTSLNEAWYHLTHGEAHRALPEGDIARVPARFRFTGSSDVSVPAFFGECGWHYLPQYFARQPPFVAKP